jgi:hypothetical protein
MSRALRILAILGAIAGCDRVFGLERNDAGPIADAPDAPPDAPPVIVDLKLEDAVTPGESVKVTATLHHTPHEVVAFALSATAGTFDTPTGNVTLDQFGLGMLQASYTAPLTGGSVMVSAMALGETATITVPILTLTSFGDDHAGTSMLSLGPNSAFGERVTVTTAGTVKALGIYFTGPNGNVKMALYTDSGGPITLVAQAGPVPQVLGRNVLPTPSTLIQPGDYFVFADFETSADVDVVPGGSYVFAGDNFNAGFPPGWSPVAFTTVSNSHLMVFVSVAN